jgi:hypothetical protein
MVGSHLGPCRKSSNRYRKFAHPQDLERDTVTIRNLIPDFVALTGERFLATLGPRLECQPITSRSLSKKPIGKFFL